MAGGGEWLAKFLYEQGLRGDDLKRMWAIGMRESGGNPTVDNAGMNRDGSTDYGLFQINGSAHGAWIKEKFGWSMEDMRDPVKNFTVMRWMSKNGKDLSAWGVANPDGTVTGWAANIGAEQRAKFTAMMNSQMSNFDATARKAGIKYVPGESSTQAPTAEGGGTSGGMNVDANGNPVNDKLNKRELSQEYGYAWRVIKDNPDLLNLFMQAFNDKTGQWTTKKFGLAIKETNWYKKNAEFARDAYVAEKTGGADWQADLQEAAQYVKAEAASLGLKLTPEQEAQYARKYIYQGWGDPARKSLMREELGGLIGTPGFEAADGTTETIANLKKIALQNGLVYDESYYVDATKQEAMGLKTAADLEMAMRQDAASKWPTYAEQIMAGANARSLASAYINTYATVMEKDPNGISLDDPTLRAAMTGVDEKGQFKQLGLWEFEQQLRSKDSWMDTKNGQDATASVGVGVLRRMGFLG
jgi:hypothetical protein